MGYLIGVISAVATLSGAVWGAAFPLDNIGLNGKASAWAGGVFFGGLAFATCVLGALTGDIA